MKKQFIVLLIIMFSPFLLSGCEKEEESVDIYASIYPVYYLTTEITKNKMRVEQMYPNGADVHEYDPISDGEMKNLVEMTEAKLMFYFGAGLEAFIDSAKKSVFADSDLKIVELTKDIVLYDSATEEKEVAEKGTHSVTADVHVWLDPILMIEMAKIIASEVIAIDSENKDYYEGNLNRLVQKLEKLDNDYNEALSSFTFKSMLIDHDAYLYLAKRYQITRIKTRVDNESCDTSPSKMIESIDIAKKNNIKYIVATKNETVCSSVETIQNEIGAEIVYLDPIATRTSETMSKDYIDLMMDNLEVLKKIFR